MMFSSLGVRPKIKGKLAFFFLFCILDYLHTIWRHGNYILNPLCAHKSKSLMAIGRMGLRRQWVRSELCLLSYAGFKHAIYTCCHPGPRL